jgi:hypothetical protein
MLAQRPKILVVDDAVSNQQLFAKVFGSEFTLELASSGMEGLALALASPPDLILLDATGWMPWSAPFPTSCLRLTAKAGTWASGPGSRRCWQPSVST